MNKKLSKTGWMLVMSLMSVTAFAQNVLTGTVYEIFDGKKEPCIGVNVAVLNTDNRLVTGVTTDYSGHYSLRIPGTEDMPEYRDYRFHIRQSCIGSLLGLPVCLLVGLLVCIL